MDPDHLDLRPFTVSNHEISRTEHVVHLHYGDVRRDMTVTLPNPNGFKHPDDDPYLLVPTKRAADALRAHLDHIPPDTISIEVDDTGKLVSFSTDPTQDHTVPAEYLPLEDYQLPSSVANKTVLRSELYEIARFTDDGVDMVSYYPPSLCPSRGKNAKGKNLHVFKYSRSSSRHTWAEIQMLARLPRHPNLVLLDRLVLDELSKSKVVGFTTRYVPNETFYDCKSPPPFKLKWLRELMQVVDDLNLKYGIVHQDIISRNLVVDPSSDSIVVFDFNLACRIGVSRQDGRSTDGEWDGRDDVKGVLFFLYELITRDPALGPLYRLELVNEEDIVDPAKWIKHPEVQLDAPVADFYFELMAWVRRRRAAKQLTHYTEAPEHIDWPYMPTTKGHPEMALTVAQRRKLGLPYIEWQRPASSKVDPARRLLGTGRYADEEAAAQKAAADAARKARRERREKGGDGPNLTHMAKPNWRPAEDHEVVPIIPWGPDQARPASSPSIPQRPAETTADPQVERHVLRPRRNRKDTPAADELLKTRRVSKRSVGVPSNKKTGKSSRRARAIASGGV